MSVGERRERLARFVLALDENGIMSFNKNNFINRLKLQKYVFIARNFGFHTNYSYGLYIRGPYSSNLADDYYAIGNYKNKMPLDLDEGFVKLVKGKSEEWLEFAATAIMIRKRYAEINHQDLVDLVRTVKPQASRESLTVIIQILEKYSCLN